MATAREKRITLVAAILGSGIVFLDATVVNIALPSIQRGLHFSATNLQWVVNGYTLIFGGFLLLGVGRRTCWAESGCTSPE